MEYLPGQSMDYRRDLWDAAGLFATIHQIDVPEEQNHLIREEAPLTLIYEECAGLLRQYFDSDLAQPEIRDYLMELINWAEAARSQETYYQQDPWHCIVNTEVNSGNFIVNRQQQTIHLVDWEMPRWGDPSQDLCHFCSPLTTLWKTNWRMTEGGKTQVFKNLQPASAGSASAGYVDGPGKTARSLCLPARNFLVSHGLGGVSDPVCRYEKPGHLGQVAAIYESRIHSFPV